MKHLGTGWLLALQFFSIIPVKKELPLEKNDVTSMYLLLPVLGLLFGGVTAATVWLLINSTELSPLFIAFVVAVIGIFLTGGLHMDGVADVGDAYFSYQNRNRRLEIMGDPRIGAFGAMAMMLLIFGKIVVLAEMIDQMPLIAIALVPVFSRIGLMVLFSKTTSAKETGLAAFFQQRTNGGQIALGAVVYLAIALILLSYWESWQLAFGLVAFLLVSLYVYRKWCLKNFGGVTGDLFGAYIEGTELLLWIAFLFFI
ncbi:adenosylcobinamide-GDP ribazoletransferase [Planomicrobium sp. CPCC 101079]|uniref:adenosylcobinamide-GDP ribazoletransferase n=1 Tax=Planomicrobium sp. CPCC 101079 TaxID=2599618 RepID=UPI0011B63EF1|nr:adenosylcobinamide-GDP ribazoletransferase [Planomicrobium sp. CPCC 101079]TWT03494.1 adenosylcobinamide-GDP ribazoletransferase [Planomicrobium sp. CPCC 101079]